MTVADDLLFSRRDVLTVVARPLETVRKARQAARDRAQVDRARARLLASIRPPRMLYVALQRRGRDVVGVDRQVINLDGTTVGEPLQVTFGQASRSFDVDGFGVYWPDNVPAGGGRFPDQMVHSLAPGSTLRLKIDAPFADTLRGMMSLL